jgi:hypothetical protein
MAPNLVPKPTLSLIVEVLVFLTLWAKLVTISVKSKQKRAEQ